MALGIPPGWNPPADAAGLGRMKPLPGGAPPGRLDSARHPWPGRRPSHVAGVADRPGTINRWMAGRADVSPMSG